ncbi:sulfatase-like hydrolase/transferase [Cohnella zeiphila]|uniref:Sulfatase-like hydrolase/transferase n=1 Tax=Cohnella zeiphila TaxID=2761120 RepID=A0A7X0SH17_9BACL|nr:sulfatase-like hydrolase/transferase [Cohnella zeiphila]MBB6729845.1 sulfatase-like hydrolase/transferase [Cohnella zeiphila]
MQEKNRRKPNILIIYCDDLGYGDLGCYGSEDAKTPHLDRLASEGIRFTNWYSNSPVCSPSRAALLTGRHPARAGVNEILGAKRGLHGLPETEVTLAKALRAAGYRTALHGKWHLGVSEETGPNAHGFDEFFGFKAGCIDFYSHIFYWGQGSGLNPLHDLWEDETEVWENGRYMTELITERSVEFIRRQAEREEPFFLYAAYNAPHYPMHAPKEYMDRFAHLPWDRQVMNAMIAAVDDGVGAIVEELKKTGDYENTMIFFSSDNGPSPESRNWLDGTEDAYYGGSAGIFRGHKFSLFDGGIREPALLSWPAGFAGGRVLDEMAAMIDIVPTFLDLAEVDTASGPLKDVRIDGSSLKPMLQEGEPSPHQQLFWEYQGQLAVREGDWKLVLNGRLDGSLPQPDRVHLSNLSEDPGERINVADRHPELTERLTRAAQEWLSGLTGDSQERSNK